MATSPRFRVAISGGGIGGLALAAFICFHSEDIAVDIYETKKEISSVGSGIAIWKRTWQTLLDIELEEEVKKRKISLPKDGEVSGPVFRKADQPTTGTDFHNHMMPYGPLTIPRPVLLEILGSRLSDLCTIHTSTQVMTYEDMEDGSVIIHMKDGSTRTADILIGCDGVHSATRGTLFTNLAKDHPSHGYEKFCEPKWCGTLVYRCMVDRKTLREKHPKNLALDQARIWCGMTKHVVTHPFGDVVGVNCFYNEPNGFGKPFHDPWVADVSVKEVVDHYLDWEPDLLEVISMVQAPSQWAIHLVESLPVFVSGRVGLLGDAAHAMTPHQGVGGGQAIEDAHILGLLLAHEKSNRSNLSKVLQLYQEVRLPLAQSAAERSWSNGLLYDFVHPDYQILPSSTAQDLKAVGQAVGKAFEWLGKGGCDDDWKRAEYLISCM